MARIYRGKPLTCGSRSVSRRRALTLVEMLVVMGICVVLALLLVPVVLRSRANARTVVCANTLNGLGQTYAICLMETGNYLPDAYYTLEISDGSYQVVLRDPETNQPDRLFRDGGSQSLVCPSDDQPVEVLGRTRTGATLAVGSSYGYNVFLPIAFRNASRVTQPVNTVTFYDGDAASIVGDWEYSHGWAEDTIRYRHRGTANYLFLDGHVEHSARFLAHAFDGGVGWLALNGESTGDGDDPEWDGGLGMGIGGSLNINPNNAHMEFTLTLPDGYQITRDDLHSDNPHQHHDGFHPDYLEYTGPAARIRVKPKGNANQNSLIVNGNIYSLENKHLYIITSDTMTVRLYNDKRNGKGKAMGKWWIEINAEDAAIEIVK